MPDLLSQYIKPWVLYRHRETLVGELPLSSMPNLRDSQNSSDALARAEMQVVQRDDDQIVLVGTVSVALEFTCQRCLQPLQQTISADFELVLVKNAQQLSKVSSDDDAIVVEDSLELAPLLEQELILTLPMIAKHDDCKMAYKNTDNGSAECRQPFSHLKDLLN